MERRQERISAAIINLGCKVNKYESDSMKDKLIAAGIDVVEPEEVADVYIVNTCSVTNMAQRKSRQMLRRAKKRNPRAVIIAAGCYVNAEYDVLKDEDFVDVVVSNNCKKDIVAVVLESVTQQDMQSHYIDVNQTSEYEEMGMLEATHLDHQRAYIKIQDGCNQFCSYCIIPYTRGRVRSRQPENILAEITKLAKEGVKEFVLTGIHISSYGLDFSKQTLEYDEWMAKNDATLLQKEDLSMSIRDLGDLVEAISEIPEVKRIRLGSLEPRIVSEEFLEKISKKNKVCPHFHMSLQSACNATLKRMNRKYTVEEFMEKCDMLRAHFELPAITTDVIVGFPGETEDEFEETIANLKKLNLYEIHVFKYSVRAGTVAEKLPNQVREEVKNARSDSLLTLTKIQKEAYEQSVARILDEVLVEELADDSDFDGVKEAKGEWSVQDVKKDALKYYYGHTTRYLKVKIASAENILNQICKVHL